MPAMRTTLLALSLLSLNAAVPPVLAADLTVWPAYEQHARWDRPIRLERQHPSTINGIVLGNLLPEGPLTAPRSAWSDVEELHLLPAPTTTDYSYSGSSTETNLDTTQDELSTDNSENLPMIPSPADIGTTGTDATGTDTNGDNTLPMIPSTTGSHLQ